jgi:TetR/AcrR family transcriptional repressor of bet genes
MTKLIGADRPASPGRPAPKRGRPSNTVERQGQIVAAFLEVMARDGYEGATIARIAKAAGISPGSVHYHFDDKREILVAAVQRLAAGIERRVDERLGERTDGPRKRLEAMLEAYVALGPGADASSVAAWVVIGAEAVREREVRALYTTAVRHVYRELRRLVGEALEADGRKTRNAGPIAAGLIAMIEGSYRIDVNAPGLLPTGFAAPMLRRTLNHLLDGEERR